MSYFGLPCHQEKEEEPGFWEGIGLTLLQSIISGLFSLLERALLSFLTPILF
jgi:hypothetical protein